MRPAIAIPAYNRPFSLQRLLDSLSNAIYDVGGICLVISVDAGGEHEQAVLETADSFVWQHGEKRIIHHPQNIGLKANVYGCAALAKEFGAVILLEDDLSVSRQFYNYAAQALNKYKSDDRIAGISLNNLWFNGYNHLPFIPLLDQGDIFFLQVAWYQGQAYSAEMWQAYESFTPNNQNPLHELFLDFPPTDWFPEMMRYLADSGRTYVFPRESLSTNWGETGTHFSQSTLWFHQPLQHFKSEWRLPDLDDALAVYDTFFELYPDRLRSMVGGLPSDFETDCYGTKTLANLRSPTVLTTRNTQSASRRWGLQARPFSANIVQGVDGDVISLTEASGLDYGSGSERAIATALDLYFNRRPPSLRHDVTRWIRSRRK